MNRIWYDCLWSKDDLLGICGLDAEGTAEFLKHCGDADLPSSDDECVDCADPDVHGDDDDIATVGTEDADAFASVPFNERLASLELINDIDVIKARPGMHIDWRWHVLVSNLDGSPGSTFLGSISTRLIGG